MVEKKTKTYFYYRIWEALPGLVERLKDLYKDDLLAVFVFGSTARGDVSQSSDVDLLVILEHSPLRKRQRVYEFYEKLGFDLGEHFLSPIILTKEEITKSLPFYAGILSEGKVLYEKDKFAKTLLNSVERLKEQGKIVEKELRGVRYFLVREEEEVEQKEAC
jgi:predicted nucleotidyltransferase